MKICSKCKVEKEYFYFGKRSYSKDGFRSECKECRKEDHIINKEERNKKSSEYYQKNRDILLKKMSSYQYDRRNVEGKIIKKSIIGEGINEQEKVCSKCMSIKSKEYFGKDNHKIDKLHSHCNMCRNKYENDRLKRDPIYKLTSNIRKRINQSFRNLNAKKYNKTTNILGCTFDEFRIYIESKFIDGMSLENYGEWHLDHIIPISYANSEDDVYRLNHYLNFQPLWASTNLSKGNRFIG